MAEVAPLGVLLVTPDPRERGRLRSGLESIGWQVWEAADGPAAVRTYAARRGEIRAAVVDLQLPGLQGAQVLAALAPGLPRCAMAADVSAYVAAAFRRLSASPLFPKPVRVEHLDATLRALIDAAEAAGSRPPAPEEVVW